MINEYSARRYCSEDISLIENYSEAVADKETWDIHHRLEVQGQFTNSVKLLKRCGMYYHQPASMLIFLKHGEHRRLHALGNKSRLGKRHTAEARKRMSGSLSGEKNPHFGTHYWNNGVISVRATTCPPGFVKGRLYRRRTPPGSSRIIQERGEDHT